MGINVLSNDVGYQGVAVAVVAGGVLAVTAWLRGLPPRAPLVRYTVRVLMVLSLAGTVVAAFGPPSWAAYLALTVAALTVTAALVPADVQTSLILLAGVTSITGGGAGVGAAVNWLVAGGDAPLGVIGIGFGVTYIGFGVAVLFEGYGVLMQESAGNAVVLIALGAAGIGAGTAWLAEGDIPLGVTSIGGGLTVMGGGIAARIGASTLFEAARSGSGAAILCGGVILLTRGDVPLGTMIAGIGMMGVLAGIATLTDSATPYTVTFVGAGIACIGTGSILLSRIHPLIGAAVIGLGVAAIGTGIHAFTVADTGRRLHIWLTGLTHDSAHQDRETDAL